MASFDLDPLSFAAGDSVSCKDFTRAVTQRVAGWSTDDNFPYQKILRYLLDPGSTKIYPLLPKEFAPVLACLLGITLEGDDTKDAPESDDDILARIRNGGEYEFEADHRNVKPRQGDQFSLERKNWHERDARIVFDDPSHSYFLDGGDRFKGSVSSAYGRWFSQFDVKETVECHMYKNWLRKPESPYHPLAVLVVEAAQTRWGEGCDAPEAKAKALMTGILKHLWGIKNDRDEAAEKGTKMHLALEQRLNGVPEEEVVPNLTYKGETTLPERQYQDFVRRVVEEEKLVPYRTEWSVYDLDCVLSGQIDSVWQDPEGRLHMMDWKRSRHADLGPEQSSYGRKGLGPCSDLDDTAFWHYVMQQNIYTLILERNYGVTVASMRLIHFHPTALGDACRVIDVPDMRHVAAEIMAIRKQDVEKEAREAREAAKRQQMENDGDFLQSPKRVKTV